MTEKTLKLPVLLPSMPHCLSCIERLRESVESLPGVTLVEADEKTSTLTIVHDTDVLSDEALARKAEDLGLQVSGGLEHAAYKVSGMDCPDCAKTLDKSVGYIEGVVSSKLNFATEVLLVEYEATNDPRDEVVSTVKKMGYGIEAAQERPAGLAELRIVGMDCPDCAAKLETRLGETPGVREAKLDFNTARVKLGYDPSLVDMKALVEAVKAAGYDIEAAVGEASQAPAQHWTTTYRTELMTAICGALIVAGWLASRLGAPEAAVVALYALAIISGGALVGRRAFASLQSKSLDMNVLMSLAVIGAAAIGQWPEGASVVFLFSLGNILEARSLARTRRSIRDLMSLAPEEALVVRAGHEQQIPAREVVVGETIVVRPGERVPLDGRVTEGSSAVDEAPVTGESVPVEKKSGDLLYAGTLNTSGLLRAEVTAAAGDTTLARIIYMVEEAQGGQAPIARLVDRFTKYYTPAVIALAVGMAIVPPVVLAALGQGWSSFPVWFYRGLVVLVVSCPCALVISTPVAIVSAITRATRDGVLVKGGAYLEAAPGVAVVAFDKTGTLTCGRPEVADVVSLNGVDASHVLTTAARLEAASTHPLAEAVLRAAKNGDGGFQAVTGELANVRDEAGRGVSGVLDGRRLTIGSPLLAEQSGKLHGRAAEETERLESEGKTVLVLFDDERAIGAIGVADQVREGSRRTVDALKRAGVRHVVMLTGDNERTAEAVAQHAGVSEFRARLLPQDKLEAVRELREKYGPVAMVGDGVNDAPALAAADIGIAMGAAASDTALETADVALLGDQLTVLPGFFALGKRTLANIKQNVAISVVIKVGVLVLAAFGVATLWMAVFADTGVSLLVTLNGLRLLRGGGETAL